MTNLDGSINQDLMIITCKKLIFARPVARIIDNGAVVVEKGIICSIGTEDGIVNKYPRHRVYRLCNAVLMPGFVNLHTHLELPPLLENIRAKSLSDWVLNLVCAKKKLNQQDYSHAASDNIKALVQSGTTTVGEICTHGESPTLLKQSGMRATVFREIIRMGDKVSSKFRIQNLAKHRSKLMQYGISPHSPYTVSESVLGRIKEISRRQNIRLAMHISESKDELALLEKKRSGLEKLYKFAHWDLDWAPIGKSSFEYLDRIDLLSSQLLAVHAVHVTNADIELIRKSSVCVAHCPRSNKELDVGRMPLRKFLDAGITVGLGTDSLASVPTLNMWDEMRYAYRIHRRDGITTEDIFRLATMGGAKALGLDSEIGSLEAGRKADIIAVPLPKKNTGDLYSDLLRETNSCIMSIVNGKILYKAG